MHHCGALVYCMYTFNNITYKTNCFPMVKIRTVQQAKPKLILKPDFSFCMAIDKTCRLTPSPTAASPIKIKMNTDEEYKQPHYMAIVLHT